MALKLWTSTEVHPGLLKPLACPPIDWTDIPEAFWGKVSAICRSMSDCLDLHNWFGDGAFCPILPVLLVIPDPKGGVAYHQIDGMGIAEVWEIRDNAVMVWEEIERRYRRDGHFVKFDELREKNGLMRREDVDAAVREALWAAAQRHKASPVTNPGRQPKYPNPRNRTRFVQPDNSGWKEG